MFKEIASGELTVSRFLAIDWDHEQLCVVEAVRKGGKTVVRRAFRWPEKLGPNPVEAEDAGLRLRQRLKEAHVSPAPVIYAVGRDRVIIRDVRFPSVPDNEVPALVRMQAAKDLPFPADEAVIDYTVSKAANGNGNGERRALAVILRKELLKSIQKTITVAGLKLEGLSLRPFGIVASGESVVRRLNGAAGDAVALLALNNGSSEFCIAREGELLFSRVVGTAPGANDGSMTAYVPELRRTLAAFGGQYPQLTVKTMLLAGVAPNNGKEDLERALQLDVVPLDPLEQVEVKNISDADRGVFAGMIGLLQSAGSPHRLPVNFLSPKRPEPPKSHAKWLVLAGVALFLMVLAGGGVVYWNQASEADRQIAELEAEKQLVMKKVQAFGDVDKRMKAVEDQTGNELIILDEIYNLIARFPDVPGVRVVEYSYTAIEKTDPRPTRTGSNLSLPGASKPAGPAAQPAKPAIEPVGHLRVVLFGSNDGLAKIRRILETDRFMKLDDKDWRQVRDADASKSQVTVTLPVYAKQPSDYVAIVSPGTNKTASGDGTSTPRNPRFPRRGGN